MKLEELRTSKGSRSDFNETWLSEMPSGLGSFETYDALTYNLFDFIKHGITPSKHGELFKLQVGHVVIYWFGTIDHVDLGAELQIKPEGLVVSNLSKDPKLRGGPPYASDLYTAMLKDGNIRIVSDKLLSDEGLKVWKTLLARGHKVTVYDTKNPGHTMRSFHTAAEMDEFFKHDDADYERYQYVLSESMTRLVEVRATFNIRRYRESVPGMPLTD